jgi:hypothetical protein
MVSFRTTVLALASAIAVSADYYIDPESVSLSDRSRLDPPAEHGRSES